METYCARMEIDVVTQQTTEVSAAVGRRADELAPTVARAIFHEVPHYRGTAPVPFDVVAAACAANLRPVLGAIATDGGIDPAPAMEVGAARARDGVPLPAVMEAYRVGFRRLWDAVATETMSRATVGGDSLHRVTAKLFAAQHIFTAAMAESYRREQARRSCEEESRRARLIDALLHGGPAGQWSMWEIADYLRLPTGGPYVVIAAHVGATGNRGLPDIESKLRSLDVSSAWLLLPDAHVGIVHITTDEHLTGVLELVARTATGRVGVSARFNDLRAATHALRFARVMLRCRADSDERVTVFDGSILSSAALAAPDLMVDVAGPMLDTFAGIGDDERDVLFETFRVWLETDGSMRTVGEVMFCHPNTVRYRLHRIERCTGRSLSKPRDIAEISLALEVHRRLI
jgi:PucR C-terminal helix-turn-helix domain/GGDEF-like domain